MKRNTTPQKILKAIKSAKNVLIIMDSRFDYDALGSVLAFSDALEQLKIKHQLNRTKNDASLVEMGGRYFDFVNFLTNNESLEDMIVKGMVYSNLKIDIKKRLAYTTLSEDEVDKRGGRGYGVVPADLLKRLKGVDFVFVIKTDSRTPDSWKISLRSHDMNFDVLKIAQRLNGGGHKVAAGCSIPFSEAKTVNDVVEKIWKIAQKTN